MKLLSKFVFALPLALPVSVSAHTQALHAARSPDEPGVFVSMSFANPQTEAVQGGISQTELPKVAGAQFAENREQFTRYATGSDGDHSLDAATVAEQVFGRYTVYTVRLQFASGHEQSISVTAPPGGLQPEMRDMSGDDIPNDLVLTSKLLRSPLVVLLNDGHDHLTVAVSPGAFASGEYRASGGHPAFHASALASPGFKHPGLGNGGELLIPQLPESLRFSISVLPSQDAMFTCSAERAPPALAPQI
jgi:hypothetical protein